MQFSIFIILLSEVLTGSADLYLKTPELVGVQFLDSSSLLQFRVYRYSSSTTSLFDWPTAFSTQNASPSSKARYNFWSFFDSCVITWLRGHVLGLLGPSSLPVHCNGYPRETLSSCFSFFVCNFLSVSPDTLRSLEFAVFSMALSRR